MCRKSQENWLSQEISSNNYTCLSERSYQNFGSCMTVFVRIQKNECNTNIYFRRKILRMHFKGLNFSLYHLDSQIFTMVLHVSELISILKNPVRRFCLKLIKIVEVNEIWTFFFFLGGSKITYPSLQAEHQIKN